MGLLGSSSRWLGLLLLYTHYIDSPMQNTGTMSIGSGAHHSSHSPEPAAQQVKDTERRSNHTRTDKASTFLPMIRLAAK